MTTPTPPAAQGQVWVRRFDRFDRLLHVFLILSFLGLAATGMPLLFSGERWASALSAIGGGYAITGLLHRLFAVLLILVFSVHLARIVRRVLVDKDLGLLWGPRSMVPQPRDLRDLYRHLLWFLGRGPRPRFDRYTYWEKFDYWAVFWGMGVIGGSGLLLWFPELFTRVLPGWLLNVATIIHGEEALLAVTFIFTVHFFNSHIRPEKFPMDMVVFTGRVPLEELKHERPDEYARLEREGRLDEWTSPPPTPASELAGRVFGTIAVLVGLTLVILILRTLSS